MLELLYIYFISFHMYNDNLVIEFMNNFNKSMSIAQCKPTDLIWSVIGVNFPSGKNI